MGPRRRFTSRQRASSTLATTWSYLANTGDRRLAASYIWPSCAHLRHQTTAPLTNFVYGGMFYNADSGLYLTKYRAYDPAAGRWLSRDPIGEASDPVANLYAYVSGNPISTTDVFGLLAFTIPQLPRRSPTPCPDDGSGTGIPSPPDPNIRQAQAPQDRQYRTWRYTHDANRRLTATIDPTGKQTLFGYDREGAQAQQESGPLTLHTSRGK
jgi:RHS repeat-associated protein